MLWKVLFLWTLFNLDKKQYEKQLVVCKDIEKENIDPLVDKRTYINKAALLLIFPMNNQHEAGLQMPKN